MNAQDTQRMIDNGKMDSALASLYGKDRVPDARKRYSALAGKLPGVAESKDVRFFSVPGRTELGGNHTDHNNGRVLAGGISLDTACAAEQTGARHIIITSDGFDSTFEVDSGDLAVRPSETGTPASIIRGIAAKFVEKGWTIGGFRAHVSSEIPIGGGLSSSASFEVLIASVMNSFYNKGAISALDIALACQYAENRFFGKPCGLMDQLSCAIGGVLAIDFRNPADPVIERVDADFGRLGYALVILGTGGHHANLTDQYAAIPEEMKSVARALGHSVLAEVDPDLLLGSVPLVRASAGDRALLRALHFADDTARVRTQVEALRKKKIADYLALVNESGDSSWQLLQNCYPPSSFRDQSIGVAIALTRRFLAGKGASRVHGSGFGGAIQAYVPNESLPSYVAFMEPIFGKGSVLPLSIRSTGATEV